MNQETDMPISDKWEGDHLDRINVARFLTQYLNGLYQESDPTKKDEGFFVLNLNATWGHGKTFLLKKWSEDLEASNYPVLMFDAWKNDYTREPLVGFISELNESLNEWANYVTPIKNHVDQLLASSKKLINIGGIVQHVVNAGIEVKTGVNPGLSKKSDTYAVSVLKVHKSMKNAIEDFKMSLTNLIEAIELEQKEDQGRPKEKQLGIKLPLYIFVDELDRCRPTYAIELLENIKHLFGIRGVFFVIATNKEQLSHSIQAVYGDSFDASGYLGRFFDQEYTLPDPDNLRYARYLINDRYQIKELLDSADESNRYIYSPLAGLKIKYNPYIDLFALYSDAFQLSLRSQGQVVHRLKAILLTNKDKIIFLDFLIFLLMLHKKDWNTFLKVTSEQEVGAEYNLFVKALKNLFNGKLILTLARTDIPGISGNKEEKTLNEQMFFYFTYLNKDKNEIVKNLSQTKRFYYELATLQDISMHTQKFASFSRYPELVRQVGQLNE